MAKIKLVIPEEVQKDYNNALVQLPMGKNDFVGFRDKIAAIDIAMHNNEMPSALILGEQGIGKTAMVEQWLYEKSLEPIPEVLITLQIEVLGALPINVMISRMRRIFTAMKKIEDATREANPDQKFTMTLFIDEIHKLNLYGFSNGSSGVMNALKEGLARGAYRLIAATTDYEYRKNIATDAAFDRRFSKIILEQPNHEAMVEILKRRIQSWQKQGKYTAKITDSNLNELIKLADVYIQNQPNPAKSLNVLANATAYCEVQSLKEVRSSEIEINHEVLKKVFKAEDYDIEMPTTADKVLKKLNEGIKGQPLAIRYLTDTINSTFYTPRNPRRPLMTILSVGTTGTGKTETAKILAEAFYGRRNAILTLNGGDYSTPDDAIAAQHFIGDNVAVRKRQVILLDEIEKSHPTVLFTYMRMIDEGVVRDSNDTERSINSTIVIATSNLGADIFNEMSVQLKLNDQAEPNKLKSELEDRWYTQESTVREALQNGDPGKNNGIKAEFLERFQLLVPYFPLPRITIAEITFKKLSNFSDDMKRWGEGYSIKMPKTKSKEEWHEILGKGSNYDNLNSISVMVAEDRISSDSQSFGARSIDRFMNMSVKPKVANLISERRAKGLSMNGSIILKLNGKASFQDKVEGGRPDIIAEWEDATGESKWQSI
jgi:ATP-dependent Clp protease ATP-binding subunit ClpA